MSWPEALATCVKAIAAAAVVIAVFYFIFRD